MAPSVPGALLLHPEWSSTAAVEAMRLWMELPEGATGFFDLAEAADRARLTPRQLSDAIALLEQAGLLAEEPGGYAKRG